MTWDMVMKLATGFVALCVGFSSVCVAGGWLLKIIKGMKKPSENTKDKFEKVDAMLDNDNKRIKKIEDSFDYIKQTQTQTLKALLVILDELKQNNDASGKISKMESDMNDFLINR